MILSKNTGLKRLLSIAQYRVHSLTKEAALCVTKGSQDQEHIIEQNQFLMVKLVVADCLTLPAASEAFTYME